MFVAPFKSAAAGLEGSDAHPRFGIGEMSTMLPERLGLSTI
jgi:hypothetical protein